MRKINHLLLLLTLFMSSTSHAGEELFTEQPSATPELANAGGYPVGVQTITVTNPSQLSTVDFQNVADRPLTLEVWYPISKKVVTNVSAVQATSYQNETRSGLAFDVKGRAYRDQKPDPSLGAFPLVVFSHGYTGYRSMMFYLAEHLASHGYVVAAIDHSDSTNTDVDFAKDPGSGFVSTLYNRARDQQFVLDALSDRQSGFSSIIDAQSAAVIGYSMGGYGALNTVGGCYAFSPKFLKGLGFPDEAAATLPAVLNSCSAAKKTRDKRWKAMVAFAPWGGEQNVHEPGSLAKITVPALIIGGDQDDVSGFENGIEKLYTQLGSSDKYLMVYDNARHNIAAHPAPKAAFSNDLDLGHYFEPSWNSETITRINKHMVLAFLNAHLKQDDDALAYLPKREQATQVKGADGKLSAPWPGFPDRWATGIRFIRANK